MNHYDQSVTTHAFHSGHVGAPNPHHHCSDCGRDLWTAHHRLRNPNGAPEINIDTHGRGRCRKCFYKHLDHQDHATVKQHLTVDDQPLPPYPQP